MYQGGLHMMIHNMLLSVVVTCVRGVVSQGVHLAGLHHIIESTNQTPAEASSPQAKSSGADTTLGRWIMGCAILSLSEEQTRHALCWWRAFCVHRGLSFLAMMGFRL